MGTKVHCKSYLPGYYSMRDLNEDASTGSWSPFYEEKMVRNGQYYNGFTPMAMDGYSEYDKEVLKQTMLRHEAIFRNQVLELHRLYRIQRDLMNELQKKELYKYPMQMETSSFNPFSSLMPSGDIQKIWQISNVSVMNSTYSRPSFSGTEDRRPVHFLKESKAQSDLSPTQNKVSINNSDLLDSSVKSQRRTFDLQLPADVYIDSDDGEGIEMEKNHEASLGSLYCQSKNNGVETVRDMNLSHGTAEKPCNKGDDRKRDSHLSSGGHTHCLADLNEPIQGIFDEEGSVSSSGGRLGPVAQHKEIQGQQLPMKQNLSFLGLSKDVFQENQKCRDTNLIHLKSACKWEGPSYNHGAGQTSTFHHDKLPMPSEELLVDTKNPCGVPQFLLSDEGKKATWLTGKASCAETPKRNSGLIGHNLTEQGAPPTPSLLPVVPCANDTDTGSSSVSSWRKPADNTTSIPLPEVQALPWLNRSPPLNRQTKSFTSPSQSGSIVKEKWDLNFCLTSQPSSTSEMPSQNGLRYGFKPENTSSPLQFPLSGNHKIKLNDGDCSSYKDSDVHGPGKIFKGLQCMDAKPVKDMNLNISLPNGFRDGTHSHGAILIDGERKDEDSLRGIPWLRTKETSTEFVAVGGLTQKDMGFQPGYSQLLSSRAVDSEPFHVKIETERGPSPGLMKDSLSALRTKEAEAHRIEIAGCSSSKIFGVPVLHTPPVKDPSPYGSSSMSCLVPSEIAGTENGVRNALDSVDAFSKPALPNLETKPFVDDRVLEKVCDRSSSCSTGFKEQINLNSVAIAVKDQLPESMEVLFKSDLAVPTSVPEARTEFEIDLEAPVILPHVEDKSLECDNFGSNNPVNHVQSIHCEVDDSQDTLARLAAESILAISTCIHCCLDDASFNSSSALRDSLLWLSEVVSANAGELESMLSAPKERGDADDESSEDGVDFFEAMTLKLTETKVEVCDWKFWERENQKKEETGTSTLLTRPRKNQRRGRQRRDFQKDILPGLVSLSRHEVTEDLQTIGGLMKASGFSWQMGVARRNAGRNGWHCRARGRRRPRGSSAVAGGGNWMGLLQRQSSNGEMEHEGGLSLQGWGKTTRRCRRQRFPMGNSPATLT